jgi:hypothetical protein
MLTIVYFQFCLPLGMSFKRVRPSIMLYYGPLVGLWNDVKLVFIWTHILKNVLPFELTYYEFIVWEFHRIFLIIIGFN